MQFVPHFFKEKYIFCLNFEALITLVLKKDYVWDKRTRRIKLDIQKMKNKQYLK